jgi:hypothetical protein
MGHHQDAHKAYHSRPQNFLCRQGKDHLLPALPKEPVRLDNPTALYEEQCGDGLLVVLMVRNHLCGHVNVGNQKVSTERTERQSEFDG